MHQPSLPIWWNSLRMRKSWCWHLLCSLQTFAQEKQEVSLNALDIPPLFEQSHPTSRTLDTNVKSCAFRDRLTVSYLMQVECVKLFRWRTMCSSLAVKCTKCLHHTASGPILKQRQWSCVTFLALFYLWTCPACIEQVGTQTSQELSRLCCQLCLPKSISGVWSPMTTTFSLIQNPLQVNR